MTALKRMAHMGIETMTLALLAPCLDQLSQSQVHSYLLQMNFQYMMPSYYENRSLEL